MKMTVALLIICGLLTACKSNNDDTQTLSSDTSTSISDDSQSSDHPGDKPVEYVDMNEDGEIDFFEAMSGYMYANVGSQSSSYKEGISTYTWSPGTLPLIIDGVHRSIRFDSITTETNIMDPDEFYFEIKTDDIRSLQQSVDSLKRVSFKGTFARRTIAPTYNWGVIYDTVMGDLFYDTGFKRFISLKNLKNKLQPDNVSYVKDRITYYKDY